MPLLAYNEFGAGRAGTATQVGLACRLARSAVRLSARGSTEARFRVVSSADRPEARKREDIARLCGNRLAGARGRSGRNVSCGVCDTTWAIGLRTSCLPEESNIR